VDRILNLVIHTVKLCFVDLLLIIIFANNRLEAQFFFMYVYFYSLHVLDTYVPIIRRINCTNTTSCICHSVKMTFCYAYQKVIYTE